MRLRFSHWAINKLTGEELRMIPSNGHRFPVLLLCLCCEVVCPKQSFLVRKSTDYNFFLVFQKCFPCSGGAALGCPHHGLGAPRGAWLWWECRRQAEPFLGAVGLFKLCIWLQDPSRLCEKTLCPGGGFSEA